MDEETLEYLWALKNANDALVEGLKLAVFTIEKINDIPPDRVQHFIKSMKELISQSEKIYSDIPTKH